MSISDPTYPIPAGTRAVLRLQSLVQPAINHLLAADSQAQGRLRAHAGKTLVFTALGIDLPWQIGADGLLHVPQSEPFAAGDADLHITVDIDALRQAIARGTPLGLSAAQVRGDADLAQTLSWVLAHVRWDAEDDLAQLIGDIPAHRLARAGQAALAKGRQVWERGQAKTRAWFAQGPRALVSHDEFAQQQDAVRDLRDRAARLQKRIAQLQQHTGANRR
jgi:ubiquinone biosynthesis protein UbiJ